MQDITNKIYYALTIVCIQQPGNTLIRKYYTVVR